MISIDTSCIHGNTKKRLVKGALLGCEEGSRAILRL